MKKFFLSSSLGLMGLIASAQIKSQSVDDIKTEAKKGADALKEIAGYALGAVMAIALIFVVWELATGKQGARDHLIAWVVAIIVILIAALII